MFIPAISPSNLTETTIWITSTETTWDVPANWNPENNSVECIGGGGGGGFRGAGGCGGHYARVSNLDISGTINIAVGGGGGTSIDGENTWFGGTDFDTSLCGARGGKGGPASSIEAIENYDASLSIGDVTHAGGNGGQNTSISAVTGFPGGGGAAGPLGPGGAGGLSGGGADRDGGGGGGGANNGEDGEDGTTDSRLAAWVVIAELRRGSGGTAAEVATDGGGGVGAKQSVSSGR